MAELQQRLGAGELVEWQAYARINPFGGEIDDYRAAIGAAVTANMHRGPDAEAVLPMELLPWRREALEREQKPQTPEEAHAAIRALLDRAGKSEGNR